MKDAKSVSMRAGWTDYTQPCIIHCFTPCSNIRNILHCFISSCAPQFLVLHPLGPLHLSNLSVIVLWPSLLSQISCSPQTFVHLEALVQCVQSAHVARHTLCTPQRSTLPPRISTL